MVLFAFRVESSGEVSFSFATSGSIAAADAAIRGLNSTRILEQSMGPITVKYATGEAEKLGFATSSTEPGQDQAKLFIGSIPRTMTEDEVRMFFSTYGTVEEVFVMKDNVQNTGKGCCFVKYAYKEEALHAIRSLSGKHTFDKCSRPVEVRFAESKAARQQQMMHPGEASTPRAAAPPIRSRLSRVLAQYKRKA